MLSSAGIIEDNGFLDTRFWDELARELGAKMRGEVLRDEPMAAHTTFRVGGPADLFLVPRDEVEVQTALTLLSLAGVPRLVIGNGSNLLVSDNGIRGAVLRLTPHFAQLSRAGDTLMAGAGAKLARVVQFAAAEALSGLESTMGIPGTIGGALVMNAGTDVGSISDLVTCAYCLTAAGERLELYGEQLRYGYRESALQGSDLVVISTCLKLLPHDRAAIHAKMARLEEKRTSRQPIGCHTAGSTFKNLPDIAAGKLLDQAGCKDYCIGGAQVSAKHANFIVAHPGARAADIRRLAEWMRRRVLEVHGRELTLEIEMLGDWSGYSGDE